MAPDQPGKIPVLKPDTERNRVRSPFKHDHRIDGALRPRIALERGPIKELMDWYRRKAHDSSSDIEDFSEADACIENMACALTPLQLRGSLQHLPLGASPVRRFVKLHLDTPDLSSMLTIEEFEFKSRSSQDGPSLNAGHHPVSNGQWQDAQCAGMLTSSSPTHNKHKNELRDAAAAANDMECTTIESEGFLNKFDLVSNNSSYPSDDDNAIDYADQTVYAESSDDEPQLIQSTPAFIPRRKRHLHEYSPANDSQMYPGQCARPSNITSPASGMLLFNPSYLLILLSKYSFSCSDSTPCPSEPNRKKVRSKDLEMTPLNPGKAKRLLDFARSIRAPADPAWTIFSDVAEISENGPDVYENVIPHQATPISQSTPANSRPSTPPKDPPPDASQPQSDGDYRFVASPNSYITPKTVHPSLLPNHKYTPASSDMRASYARGDYAPRNYHILGEVPVTAAGLMDESQQDVHVGDKRIGDPYASRQPRAGHATATNVSLEQAYRDPLSIKLPLPPPFFYNQQNMPKHDLLLLVRDSETIWRFYTLILGEQNPVQVIKSDRLRWHPDKWEARMRDDHLFFDLEIVVGLAQLINTLINDREG